MVKLKQIGQIAGQPSARLDRLRAGRKRYRQGYREDHIKQLMASFANDQNVSVPGFKIDHPNYDFELLGGHHTVEALRRLGRTEVLIDEKPVSSDRDIARYSYQLDATNLPFDYLEDTRGILDNLIEAFRAASMEADAAYLKTLFGVIRKGRPVDDSVMQVVNSVWDEMQPKVSIKSFAVKRMPLLELPDDLQTAISDGLSPTAAIAIAKVDDPEQRSELLRGAMEDGLSATDIKAAAKSGATPKPEKPDYLKDYQAAGKVLRKINWDDVNPQKRAAIAQKLAELKKLLSE